MVLADPAGSILAPLIKTGEMVEAGLLDRRGHRRGFRAANCDLSLVEATPTRSPTARASRRRATCWRRRASSAARPPAPCWPRRCATAASRPSPSGWSPSSATAATNTCPRSTTTTGWPSRASPTARITGDLRDLIARTLRRGRHRDRRPGRHAAHRLQPHAHRRRQPAAGAGRRPAGRHPRRERPPARASRATTSPRAAVQRPVRHGDDRQAEHRCRPTSRWTRCCRSSSATRWPSCWTATSSSA